MNPLYFWGVVDCEDLSSLTCIKAAFGDLESNIKINIYFCSYFGHIPTRKKSHRVEGLRFLKGFSCQYCIMKCYKSYEI